MLFTDLLYYKVRCNMCMFEGDEDDLVFINDDGEYVKSCPNCKTDWYLTELPVK